MQKAVVVIGAGDATGGAIAERFAKEGYAACLVRRNGEKLAPLVARIEESGGKAFAFGVDARIEGGINTCSNTCCKAYVKSRCLNQDHFIALSFSGRRWKVTAYQTSIVGTLYGWKHQLAERKPVGQVIKQVEHISNTGLLK